MLGTLSVCTSTRSTEGTEHRPTDSATYCPDCTLHNKVIPIAMPGASCLEKIQRAETAEGNSAHLHSSNRINLQQQWVPPALLGTTVPEGKQHSLLSLLQQLLPQSRFFHMPPITPKHKQCLPSYTCQANTAHPCHSAMALLSRPRLLPPPSAALRENWQPFPPEMPMALVNLYPTTVT